VDRKWRIFGAAIMLASAIVAPRIVNDLHPEPLPSNTITAPFAPALPGQGVVVGPDGTPLLTPGSPLPDGYGSHAAGQGGSATGVVQPVDFAGDTNDAGATNADQSAGDTGGDSNLNGGQPGTGGGSPQDPSAPPVVGIDDASVSTSIPDVSFGAIDDLPATLVRGRSYTVHFPVIGADPTQQQTASLLARGLLLDPSCTDYPLAPAEVTQLTCTVTVKANAISVQLRAASGAVGSKILRHAVDNTIRASANLSVSPSATSVGYGAPRSINATVSAPGYTPLGTVTVTLDGSPLAPSRLAGGTAQVALPVGMTLGTHTYSVRYSGDAWVAGITSSSGTITVTKAVTSIAQLVLSTPTSISVYATLAADGFTSFPGSLSLSENGDVVTSAPAGSGVVTFPLPDTITSGTHRFVVSYPGTSLIASASATVSVVVP